MSFSDAIVAIIASFANLGASDLLITTRVTYLTPSLRGLEPGDMAGMLDPKTIFFTTDASTDASTPVDLIRVLTTSG